MENNTFIVEEDEGGVRLDKLLTMRFPQYSRTYFQYLIEKNLVLLNGEIVKKREIPKPGDEIEIEFALTSEISLEPENIPLDILYEDEDLLIINKPAGMVVHPGAGNPSHTFVNALLFHCKSLKAGTHLRPGIVHRLDKDTSGVLMAAKNERAQEKLVSYFATRKIEKEYLAICIGNPQERTVKTHIGRHPIRRKEMAVLEDKGKEAVTHIKTLSYDDRFSVVSLFPETGRTHQLRVHLQYVKTPILGDPIYGNTALNKKYGVSRTLLHAKSLRFHHPLTNTLIEVSAPIPEDIQEYINRI